MLLVKSKELKNSSKKSPLGLVLAGFISICHLSYSPLTQAQSSSQSIDSTESIITVFLSLMLVIAIIFALAYLMRRFNVTQAGQGQMQVVASMVAGTKEKVMVIQVGDEQHLIGVTSHNINHLAKLEEPLKNKSKSASAGNDPKANFQQKLVHAMAQGLVGGKAKSSSTDKSSGGSND